MFSDALYLRHNQNFSFQYLRKHMAYVFVKNPYFKYYYSCYPRKCCHFAKCPNQSSFFYVTFAKLPTCQSCLWWLNDFQVNLKMYSFEFVWMESSTYWCTNAFTNEYIMLKYLKHSPTRLLGSLLTIIYWYFPNYQIGKAFRKKLYCVIIHFQDSK